MKSPPRWIVVSPPRASGNARLWSSFASTCLITALEGVVEEFVDDDGRLNEVDLLFLGPFGLTIVEIKNQPGTVDGDGRSWIWTTDGRRPQSTIRSCWPTGRRSVSHPFWGMRSGGGPIKRSRSGRSFSYSARSP
jgi:Nuclease-related domain